MKNVERVRESLPGVPAPEYFQSKIAQGWKPVSIEWERAVETADAPGVEAIEPIPFGLQIADDCQHLKENSNEKHALMFMMERIVKDEPLSKIADELNRGGYRNRDGNPWTPGQVFDMLPRLIDVGPGIFTNREYIARKHGQTRQPQ